MKNAQPSTGAADRRPADDGAEKNPRPDKKKKEHEEEILDDELDDTFPASDPPSTSVPGTGIKRP